MTNSDYKHILIADLKKELSDYHRIMKDLYGFSDIDILDDELQLPLRAEEDVKKLKKGYPVDYLIGHVEIFHLKFNVDERVLIPRIETEELISNVVERESANKVKNVLDICTGSGFIAISLAKLLPSKPHVYATDISKDAIDVAYENAINNKASVTYKKADILQGFDFDQKFDIVISNPPYIQESEQLDDSLGYEPNIALYGGNDGLEFYKRIASEVKNYVTNKTRFYFECSPLTAEGVIKIMTNEFNNHHFYAVKDMSNKIRFVYGICRL